MRARQLLGEPRGHDLGVFRRLPNDHLTRNRRGGFVVEDDGRLVGYFAFLPSPEPTYDKIYEGAWLDDERPYHVVHRIASYPDVHGIFGSIMDFCFRHDGNLRIDTHRDNLIMQHLMTRHGFAYCGIIYLTNGDERLAYQLVRN